MPDTTQGRRRDDGTAVRPRGLSHLRVTTAYAQSLGGDRVVEAMSSRPVPMVPALAGLAARRG
jgi:hypothetical protein